jgi:murein L,D-transpeptidase YcbB/YkuD
LRTVAPSIVANPPWDIPADIAANQLLPHLKQNPNYLAAHNMIVVNAPGDPHGRNIPWSAVSSSNFPYSIRQLPPRSALGVLMLDSPNRFDVYLHDTPAKQFFSKSDREISNGCVRVEEIMSLASLALTNSPSAGLAQLHSAIDSHETRRIMLDEPLPTCFIGRPLPTWRAMSAFVRIATIGIRRSLRLWRKEASPANRRNSLAVFRFAGHT